MPESTLYDCRIVHRRPGPPRYRFAYRAFYLWLDLDRLDADLAGLRLLSRNRFNLMSFHDRDHGARDGGDPAAWARARLADMGVDAGGRVRLLCMPRILGYGFNPISLYYCENAAGALVAVIAEVHNTFGEQHSYVLHNDGGPVDLTRSHDKAKVFHVSPLLERAGRYRFRLVPPGERMALGIRLLADDGSQRIATALSGHRQQLADRNLLALFLRIPVMTVKVTLAIHWQALKIWWRGARFHAKPEPHRPNIS
ncbi:DUF1365 domain-containing protein [Salinisphaera sp. P385]|uniref:DUF1365 domain-containing protein n=1 Tax=Spectribacter acetivorans TaxID=3075603 RepID=A0ABU3BB13_9GAMM|nr:DUF1365 domain-containing protein [Salinisphaera sp. P385]MDT0619661.1 DUF1365 domain-containing protein [Salinisphaera sp. P385]